MNQQLKCIACAAVLSLISQPAFSLQLQGRIEQIVNDPDLKLTELHATQLSLPKAPTRTNSVAPELKSFPAILRGEWKGKLEITTAEVSDSFSAAEPEDANKEADMVKVGKLADADFNFYTPRRGVVTMAPPAVKMLLNPPPAKPRYLYFAITDFDNPNYVSPSGLNTMKSQLVKNKVRMLSSDVVENDIVVKVVSVNKNSGAQKSAFCETVYQFKKAKPFELHAQVAQVSYGSDGSWWEKTVFEGDLH